jgi:hypothetical protein
MMGAVVTRFIANDASVVKPFKLSLNTRQQVATTISTNNCGRKSGKTQAHFSEDETKPPIITQESA